MSDTKRLSRRAFGALAAAAPVAAIAQQQTANPGNAPNPNTAAQIEQQQRRPPRPPDVQPFDLPVDFPTGIDRVEKTEDVFGITIPRADIKVSGANFEVLVGFDVTPQMADFNRNGERFRVNAGETQAQASGPGVR